MQFLPFLIYPLLIHILYSKEHQLSFKHIYTQNQRYEVSSIQRIKAKTLIQKTKITQQDSYINQFQKFKGKSIISDNYTSHSDDFYAFINKRLTRNQLYSNYKLNYQYLNKNSLSQKNNKEKIHGKINARLLNVPQSQNSLKMVSLVNTDYIVNGNFSINGCTKNYCSWNQTTFRPSFLPGWGIIRGLQMADGPVYNARIGSKKAIQLNTNIPTCIYQNITSLLAGIYNLTYTYTVAATIDRLVNGTFLVYVNDTLLSSVTQTDYLLNNRTIQITNLINYTSLSVMFCAKDNFSTNAVISIVRLILVQMFYAEIKSDEYLYGQKSYLLNSTIDLTLNNFIIKQLNRIPASRIILKPLFSFFINLDHLWLYMYHKRNYSAQVNSLLNSIQTTQNQKWQFISSSFLQKYFSFNVTIFKKYLDFKRSYTSSIYVQVQDNGSTFIQNTVQYFCVNVPLVMLVFFIGNIFFRLVYKSEISIFFKHFSFQACLMLLLLEGNVESFSYLFSYDCLQLFSLNEQIKAFNILSIVIFFFFILILAAGYYLILSVYKKEARNLFDNCQGVLVGSSYLIVQKGIFNLLLGMVHLIFENFPDVQLMLLSLIEISYISFILMIIKRRIFQLHYIVWSNIIASFLRVSLIFTYYVHKNDNSDSSNRIQQIQQLIIIIYLNIWIINFVISIIMLLNKINRMIRRKNTIKYEKRILIKEKLNKNKKLQQEFKKKLNRKHIQPFNKDINIQECGLNYLQQPNLKIEVTFNEKYRQQNKNLSNNISINIVQSNRNNPSDKISYHKNGQIKQHNTPQPRSIGPFTELAQPGQNLIKKVRKIQRNYFFNAYNKINRVKNKRNALFIQQSGR